MQKILKAARKKQFGTFEGDPIRASADFSAKILWPRREGHDIFKGLKEKTSNQQDARYPTKLSFRKR